MTCSEYKEDDLHRELRQLKEALSTERKKHAKTKQKLRQAQSKTCSLSNIPNHTQIMHDCGIHRHLEKFAKLEILLKSTESEILDFVRESIARITGSKYSFISVVDQDEPDMILKNGSDKAIAECMAKDKLSHFVISEAGLLSEAAQQRKAFVVNDHTSEISPSKHRLPYVHAAIKRFLCVPVFEDNKIIMVAAVANKETDYSTSDVEVLSLTINHVWRIIEHKRKNEQLQLFSRIMENMFDGLYLIEAETGIIVYANSKFEEMFGYNSGEIIGKHVSIVNAPSEEDPRLTASRVMSELVETGQWHGNVHNIKKNGTTFWCSAKCSIGTHPKYGKVIVSVHQDISEHKCSETIYDIVINNSRDGFVSIDQNGTIIDVNDAYCRQVGYSREELLNMSIRDLDVYESKEETEKHIKKVIKDGQDIFETQQRRKDGHIIDLEISVNYIPGSGGLLFGFHRDISERKHVQDALKKSEETIRVLLNTAPDSMLLIKPDGTIVACNKTYASEFNRTPIEMINQNALGLMPPDLAERQLNTCKDALENGLDVMYEDTRDQRIFKNHLCPILDNKGNVNQVAIYAKDITNERHAQYLAKFGTWSIDLITKEINCSCEIYTLLGYNVGAKITCIDENSNPVHPDDYPHVADVFIKAMQSASPVDIEFRVVRIDGTIRYIHCIADMIYNDTQEPIAIRGSAQDITMRKNNEMALEQQRYYLEESQKMGLVGTWEVFVKDNVSTGTNQRYHIYEIPVGTELTFEKHQEMVVPEDREKVRRAWLACLRGKIYNIKYRVKVTTVPLRIN